MNTLLCNISMFANYLLKFKTTYNKTLNVFSVCIMSSTSNTVEGNLNNPNKVPEAASINNTVKDLSDFKVKRILGNNSQHKVCFLEGAFADKPETAILILEKKAFAELHLLDKECGYFTQESVLVKDFVNDIYGNYECFPRLDINGVKATIIYPATEKHIQKFVEQEIHIINETPEVYKTITLPHIGEDQLSLQWVYNIIDHKKEAERVLVEDACEENGFVIIPDLKWDGKTLETLYYLALVKRKGIKSIRDLNTSHLPLLKNIQEKGCKAIEERFGIRKDQMRIYFHYQPSFYHLHIHFTYIKHEAPGIFCEKSHLLDSVVNNIELKGDYYQQATLPFVVLEQEVLFDKLIDQASQLNRNFVRMQSPGDRTATEHARKKQLYQLLLPCCNRTITQCGDGLDMRVWDEISGTKYYEGLSKRIDNIVLHERVATQGEKLVLQKQKARAKHR